MAYGLSAILWFFSDSAPAQDYTSLRGRIISESGEAVVAYFEKLTSALRGGTKETLSLGNRYSDKVQTGHFLNIILKLYCVGRRA